MWKKFTDFLNHPIIQLFGGAGVLAVITWFLTHLAKLPIWEIWLAVIFVVMCAVVMVNQYSSIRERSKKGLTKLSDKELEDTMRTWVYRAGITFTREEVPEHYFTFVLQYADNKFHIAIVRAKKEP